MLLTISSAQRALLQLHQILGKPHSPMRNSTLNQKLEIMDDPSLSNNQVPALRYIVNGGGGQSHRIGPGNKPYLVPRQHTPTHTGMFELNPWVLRPISNPLTPLERENLRLRRLEDHGGVIHEAYYARVLDTSDVTPSLEIREIEDGVVKRADPYVPTLSDLSPIYQEITTNIPVTTSKEYIVATAAIPFIMTENDVTELLNVARILWGNENLAKINELALCTGSDVTATASLNGSSITYQEVVACQVASWLSPDFSATSWRRGAKFNLQLGNHEPMVKLTTLT